jgi:cell shape-determining protein MreC
VIDAYSETWQAVSKKAEEIIDACRSRLEANEQSHAESQFLRGQIAAARQILHMVKPATVPNKELPPEAKARDRSGI